MRYWRPFLALLALISRSSAATPGESSLERKEGASPWKLCRSSASPLLPPTGGEDTELRGLVHGDGLLFFTVDDGVHGRELWTSTGTQGPGTALLKDLRPGPIGSAPVELTRVGSRIFFAADDGVHGAELWVSDGSSAGTRMVKDLWPGPDGSFPQSLSEFKGVLYFSAGEPEHGRELWRSDGTPQGTFLVEDLDPGVEGTSPDLLTPGGDGGLYFISHVQGFHTALMRSNGGPGAVELARVPSNGGILESLIPVGRRLFFVMGEIHHAAVDLMVTDGQSTTRVGMFVAPGDWAVLGGRLFFGAALMDTPDDRELWRSDGTPRGTWRIKDIQPGPAGASPASLQPLGRQCFFVADDGVHGQELWVSDGSASGTRLLADLEPGLGGSSPGGLAALQGSLFFSAETSGRGREPWVSDGTTGGTVALGELAPGTAALAPRGFLRSGWDVFFLAGDDTQGPGLWALPFRPEGRCEALPR